MNAVRKGPRLNGRSYIDRNLDDVASVDPRFDQSQTYLHFPAIPR
jgi:hypothetical protein